MEQGITREQIEGMTFEEIKANAEAIERNRRKLNYRLSEQPSLKVLAAKKIAALELGAANFYFDVDIHNPAAEQERIAKEVGMIEGIEQSEEISGQVEEVEQVEETAEPQLKTFEEKVSDLKLTEEERQTFAEIVRDSNANSRMVKMLSQGKRNQRIALTLMGNESKAREILV